jgi:hypothetical protein
MAWWMKISQKGPNQYVVNYNILNSGTFSTEVSEETARMLERAKEAGKDELRAELRKTLGL